MEYGDIFTIKNMIKISETEIRKRMQKLRNYENLLYPLLKERNNRLRTKLRTVNAENKKLKKENQQIEKLLLELEELKAMKFGKKREKWAYTAKVLPKRTKKTTKEKRSPGSYRRPEPNLETITDYLRMEINECPECEMLLENKQENKHYREDLYEVENLIESAKKIVETIVESGRCPKCGKRQYAMEIPKQKVTIGQNIRNMVVYLIIVQGLSYTETQRSLKHQYGIELSNGEIINILEGESHLVSPYYNYLVETLEQEDGSHYDETSWKTKSYGKEISEGNYCWVKVGIKSENRLIWFGRSRGKGIAEKLRGKKEGSIGISDDYGGYRNCFEHHQLCWAHPHRKLRDLAESGSLSKTKKKVCRKTFKYFSKVYKKARQVKEKLESEDWTEEKKLEERNKLEKQFDVLFEPNPDDSEKLKAIRKSLKERKNRYFTFFDFSYLPLDNNKAERALRKVVIKRKKSFGCRSAKGANVLSILYSVVFSLMESNPNQNFFSLYKQAIEFEPDQN